MNNKVVAIVFSKDRPLQLDLILSGLYKYCLDGIETAVLYTVSNLEQEYAYDIIMKEHYNVVFWKENNFKQNLLDILQNKTHALFLVDDCILTHEFHIDNMFYMMISNVIGFSLRLGKNIDYCYTMNVPQQVESYYENKMGMLENWAQGQYDFNYPLDLSSSFYSIETIGNLLKLLEYSNPNQLEYYLDLNKGLFKDTKPYLAMFEQSIAFCAPMNIVQNVAPNNRVSNNSKYSIENLLKIYLKGFRINPETFYDYIPNSPHSEVDILCGYK